MNIHKFPYGSLLNRRQRERDRERWAQTERDFAFSNCLVNGLKQKGAKAKTTTSRSNVAHGCLCESVSKSVI